MAFHAVIAELSLSWNSGSFTLSRSNFGGADFGRGGCETGFAVPADGGVVEAGRCKSLASRPLFEGTARGRPRVSSGALVKKAVMLPVSFAVAAVDCAGALLPACRSLQCTINAFSFGRIFWHIEHATEGFGDP